jgi:hypothetical protein
MNKSSLSFFLFKVFTNENHDKKKELYAALFFIVFIGFGLWLDSVYFAERFFDGRWLMNIFAIGHFLYFFYVASTKLRKLMFIMVPLSYLGEEMFCNWFDMYDYRNNQIPLYVPFGHALLYATGWVCSKTDWAIQHKQKLTSFFIVFFAVVLFGVGIVFNDVLTLIYAVVFFWVMRRKKWASLYFFMSLWVIALELVGTYYQCWGWHPVVFKVIPTVNPPLGALVIYVCGDIVLNKLFASIDRRLVRVKPVSG